MGGKVLTCREEYVQMKVKEKGLDPEAIFRGSATSTAGPNRPASGRFNAFRELEKMKQGVQPQLAKIGDDVTVVGTPLKTEQGQRVNKKRERDDEDEEGKGKTARSEVCFLPYYMADSSPLKLSRSSTMAASSRWTVTLVRSSTPPRSCSSKTPSCVSMELERELTGRHSR
jgi:hypothetical protein